MKRLDELNKSRESHLRELASMGLAQINVDIGVTPAQLLQGGGIRPFHHQSTISTSVVTTSPAVVKVEPGDSASDEGGGGDHLLTSGSRDDSKVVSEMDKGNRL